MVRFVKFVVDVKPLGPVYTMAVVIANANEQVKGSAMGSPISPIVANLFMEDLEVKALSTAPTPPTLWKRFVDDTFIIIKNHPKNPSYNTLTL